MRIEVKKCSSQGTLKNGVSYDFCCVYMSVFFHELILWGKAHAEILFCPFCGAKIETVINQECEGDAKCPEHLTNE